VCLKDYLIKLFLHMMNYNIDSELILMMKDLILVKSDFEYFDKIFMKLYLKNN
jgi:hypothetical protein